MIPLELLAMGPTDLTWEEKNSSNLIFKGDYLNTIDKSFQLFEKNYKKKSIKRKKVNSKKNKSKLV